MEMLTDAELFHGIPLEVKLEAIRILSIGGVQPMDAVLEAMYNKGGLEE